MPYPTGNFSSACATRHNSPHAKPPPRPPRHRRAARSGPAEPGGCAAGRLVFDRAGRSLGATCRQRRQRHRRRHRARPAPAARAGRLRLRRLAGAGRRPDAGAAAQPAGRPLCARCFRRRGGRRALGDAVQFAADFCARRRLRRCPGGDAHGLRPGARRRQLDAEPPAADRGYRRRRLRRGCRPDPLAGPGTEAAQHAVLADGRSLACRLALAGAGRRGDRPGPGDAHRARPQPARARRPGGKHAGRQGAQPACRRVCPGLAAHRRGGDHHRQRRLHRPRRAAPGAPGNRQRPARAAARRHAGRRRPAGGRRHPGAHRDRPAATAGRRAHRPARRAGLPLFALAPAEGGRE